MDTKHLDGAAEPPYAATEKTAAFAQGQLVRTVYGETKRVVLQRGCQVFLEGELNRWWHPSKLVAVVE